MDERTDGWTDGRMDGPARARQKTLNGRNWLRLVRLLTIVALSSPSSATSNRASSYEKLQLLSVPRSNAAAIIVPLARASVSRSPSLPRRYFCSTCVEHVAHEHEYQYESLAERLARLGGFDLAAPPGPEEDSSGMTRVFESSFLFSFSRRRDVLCSSSSFDSKVDTVYRLFQGGGRRGEIPLRGEWDETIDYRGDKGRIELERVFHFWASVCDVVKGRGKVWNWDRGTGLFQDPSGG